MIDHATDLAGFSTADLLAEVDRRTRAEQPPIVHFFGVWPGAGAGHHRRDRHGAMLREESIGREGHLYPWDTRREFRREQFEGKFWHWHHPEKPLTLLTSWDRSEDERGNCCSAFIVHAHVTPEHALKLARADFPKVFSRIEAHLGRAVELAGPVDMATK